MFYLVHYVLDKLVGCLTLDIHAIKKSKLEKAEHVDQAPNIISYPSVLLVQTGTDRPFGNKGIASVAFRFVVGLGAASFGQNLENALPNLFTFVNDPDMDPTNNEAERMLRKVVLHRKNRYRIASQQGMETFSNLMMCHLTWLKNGLDPRDMLLEVLCST